MSMSWAKGDRVVELRQGRKQNLTLGDSLAFGGTGEVFSVAGSEDLCVNMIDDPTPRRQGKLRELVSKHDQGRVRDSDAAWPRGLTVGGPDDTPVGYTMDKIHGRSLAEVAADPSVDFAMRAACARSLCEVVTRLHGTQQTPAEDRIVGGDVDLANVFLDSRTGQCRLIDTDGMQIASNSNGKRLAYPTCELRACSPETVGKKTGSYLLTSRHDWFLIAICVSRLLMPGDPLYTEPETGVDRREARERVVAARLYPYEEHYAEWELPAPAKVLGAELAALLHRSFTGPWDQIPSTTDYVSALERLESQGSRTCETCGCTWSAAASDTCPYCGATRASGVAAPVAATRLRVAPVPAPRVAGSPAGGFPASLPGADPDATVVVSADGNGKGVAAVKGVLVALVLCVVAFVIWRWIMHG